MQVLPQCGHAVQEDTPDRVAEVLATFLLRHRLTTPKADFNRQVDFLLLPPFLLLIVDLDAGWRMREGKV